MGTAAAAACGAYSGAAAAWRPAQPCQPQLGSAAVAGSSRLAERGIRAWRARWRGSVRVECLWMTVRSCLARTQARAGRRVLQSGGRWRLWQDRARLLLGSAMQASPSAGTGSQHPASCAPPPAAAHTVLRLPAGPAGDEPEDDGADLEEFIVDGEEDPTQAPLSTDARRGFGLGHSSRAGWGWEEPANCESMGLMGMGSPGIEQLRHTGATWGRQRVNPITRRAASMPAPAYCRSAEARPASSAGGPTLCL